MEVLNPRRTEEGEAPNAAEGAWVGSTKDLIMTAPSRTPDVATRVVGATSPPRAGPAISLTRAEHASRYPAKWWGLPLSPTGRWEGEGYVGGVQRTHSGGAFSGRSRAAAVELCRSCSLRS